MALNDGIITTVSSPMGNARGEGEEQVFRAPLSQRVGDAAMVLLLLPIAIAAASFLCLMAVTYVTHLIGVEDVSQPWVGGIAVGLATVILGGMLLRRPGPAWSVRLGRTALRLDGPFRHREIAYDSVVFVRAANPHRWEGGSRTPGAVPLVIETRGHETWTIQLSAATADACLRALRSRARAAAAVDADGHEYLPVDDDAVPAGVRRLTTFWSSAGWTALAAGLLGLLVGAVKVARAAFSGDSDDLWDGIRLAVAGFAAAAFGWRAIGRASRRRRRGAGRSAP